MRSAARCGAMPSMLMQRGITLIELIIVVVIAGILSAIAIPASTGYTLRAARTVGKSAIMRIAAQQESFYTDRKQYSTTLNGLSPEYGAATLFLRRDGTLVAVDETSAIYSVTLTGASATAFTIQATPIHQQAHDKDCLILRYTNTGSKTATGPRNDCWSR